jgi:hypothetical protein
MIIFSQNFIGLSLVTKEMLTDVHTSVIIETLTRFIIRVVASFISILNRMKLQREFRIQNKGKRSGQMNYSGRLRWTCTVALRGQKIKTGRIIDGNAERKKKLARPGYR